MLVFPSGQATLYPESTSKVGFPTVRDLNALLYQISASERESNPRVLANRMGIEPI